MENTDTQPGGETLSIDEAAKAYAATQTKEPEGQPEDDEEVEATTDDELQASDEGEGEETDGETDPDSEAEDENDADPESDQGRFVAGNGKHRLADGTVITVAELAAGYMKDGDYRQKTTEAANLKREAVAAREAVEASKKEIEEQRAYVASLVKSIIPAAPDPALLDTDPMAYMRQENVRKQWMDHLAYLDQQSQQTAKERAAKAEAEAKEKGQREWGALLEKLPDLKDEKKLDRFVSDIKTYGKTYGFTPQELGRVAMDHRQAVVLSKAIKWDKLQASKAQVAKKVEGKPPVQKGGKRLNPSDARARQATDAMNRLKQTGSVEDATAAWLATLNKG